jgi:hypothetical protein
MKGCRHYKVAAAPPGPPKAKWRELKPNTNAVPIWTI